MEVVMDSPYVYHKEFGVGVVLEENDKHITKMCLVAFSDPEKTIWIDADKLQVLERNNERV